jgi:subtilisin family serine protease
VSVAVVDTGFQTNHPFYQSRGYQFAAVSEPGDTQPTHDLEGHGTAITWNVFAVAPGAHVTGVKYAKSPYQDALEIAAEEHGARIISCSWCWDYEQSFPILEATIKSLVEEDGIIVLFAAGNGHHAWPASMPQVISVGGVYADQQNTLQASNYASGFMSSLYPNRRVPDVSGLCGQKPLAIYIPMPCPAGCDMDENQRARGARFPDGDETVAQDGWTVASGTSSATPQVAGVVALLLEEAQRKGAVLTPAQVRGLLEQTAQSVTQGRNAFGFPAVGQPNVACGYGLVDATQLLTVARVQGLI